MKIKNAKFCKDWFTSRVFQRYVMFLLVGPMLAFSATCPKCLNNSSYTSCSENLPNCEFRLDVTPSVRVCSGSGSDFECFSNSYYTRVTMTSYEGTGWCPDCNWTKITEVVLDVRECWTDDTGCGGNG
jgi:hypothetical protein